MNSIRYDYREVMTRAKLLNEGYGGDYAHWRADLEWAIRAAQLKPPPFVKSLRELVRSTGTKEQAE